MRARDGVGWLLGERCRAEERDELGAVDGVDDVIEWDVGVTDQ